MRVPEIVNNDASESGSIAGKKSLEKAYQLAVSKPNLSFAVWYLLSSLLTDSVEQVQRIVRFYALRWRIERFH